MVASVSGSGFSAGSYLDQIKGNAPKAAPAKTDAPQTPVSTTTPDFSAADYLKGLKTVPKAAPVTKPADNTPAPKTSTLSSDVFSAILDTNNSIDNSGVASLFGSSNKSSGLQQSFTAANFKQALASLQQSQSNQQAQSASITSAVAARHKALNAYSSTIQQNVKKDVADILA